MTYEVDIGTVEEFAKECKGVISYRFCYMRKGRREPTESIFYGSFDEAQKSLRNVPEGIEWVKINAQVSVGRILIAKFFNVVRKKKPATKKRIKRKKEVCLGQENTT